MPRKLKFPIAKVRQDGTPAIWLTFGNWMLLKDGILRKYVEIRESAGRARARNEARKRFFATWRNHPRLESWHFLDSTHGWFESAGEVLEIYRVGAEAHPSSIDYSGRGALTADKLVEIGDKREHVAYCEELLEIKANPVFDWDSNANKTPEVA